ncbi:MAG: helix-turn-helix domain-containing protein [Anaerolineae bacterium]
MDRKQETRKSSHLGFETSYLQDLHLWMTTQEAAEYSGYDVEHVRRLARQGKIGAVKKGRDWWIDVEQFTAYLNAMIESEDGRAGPKPTLRQTP